MRTVATKQGGVPMTQRKIASTTGHNGIPASTVTALGTVRGARLLEKVASGLTITEAARELNLSRQQASRIFNAELRRVAEGNPGLRQQMLTQALETLRLLHRAFMPSALNGAPDAAKIVLAVLDRQAKYLGLDAAIKIEISNDRVTTAVDEIVELLDADVEPPMVLEAETEPG